FQHSYTYTHLLAMYSLTYFFTATPTTEIYTLSLHDALPICTALQIRSESALSASGAAFRAPPPHGGAARRSRAGAARSRQEATRSEEHTSELQSPYDLVCRLLLEKKKERSRQNCTEHKDTES